MIPSSTDTYEKAAVPKASKADADVMNACGCVRLRESDSSWGRAFDIREGLNYPYLEI